MAKKKNNTYLYVGLAAASLLLFKKKNNGIAGIHGADDKPFIKIFKTEYSVLNCLIKLIGNGRKAYVYYDWENRTYTVSTVLLEERFYFRRIEYLYPGSHIMDLLRPYHINNWRKITEEKMYK